MDEMGHRAKLPQTAAWCMSTAAAPPSRRLLTSLGYAFCGVGVGMTATAGLFTWMLENDTETQVARFLRSAVASVKVGLEFRKAIALSQPQQKEAVLKAHELAAAQLLSVCRAHGGLYNKLGQFVASMSGSSALPAPYTTLSACEDRAVPVPFDDAKRLIEAELQQPMNAIFAEFEEKSLAAASLAQVHRAVTLNGEAVAVKVQYPNLQRQVEADIRTLRFLAWVLGRAFPGYGYEWLIPEFEASLRGELDFRREAENARRISNLFSEWPEIHVPVVLDRLSGGRVLTMEWIDGVKLSDETGLADANLDASQCARILSQAFSAMIFEFGFVHCDPHAGNLLARRMPDTALKHSEFAPASPPSWFNLLLPRQKPKIQLVLLDHGMYRELTPSFRSNYCRLWHSLLTRSHANGRAAAQALGVPAAEYDTLSLLLTHRPSGSRGAIGTNMSAEERQAIRERYRSVGAADVNAFLESLPRDMLFVMRTWSLVRSLNRRLGGTTRQRFLIMSEMATRGMLQDEGTAGKKRPDRASWRKLVRLALTMIRTQVEMYTLDLVYVVYRRLYCITSSTGRQYG